MLRAWIDRTNLKRGEISCISFKNYEYNTTLTFDKGGHGEDTHSVADISAGSWHGDIGKGVGSISHCEHWLWKPYICRWAHDKSHKLSLFVVVEKSKYWARSKHWFTKRSLILAVRRNSTNSYKGRSEIGVIESAQPGMTDNVSWWWWMVELGRNYNME